MSDFEVSQDPFDDSIEDDLDEVMQRTTVNREVHETVVRRQLQVQRTLTGEALQGEKAVYEEVLKEVTFRPTHHEMNQEALRSYVYPSNLLVRDYQYDIIAKALFKNLLCAIPTGMGKTFIASTVMLNYYRWFKKGKIIFMAPTRPLVAQQIQACLGVTDIPSEDTAVLLDKTRKNRPAIWNDKRVFFTTPQVVENDLKAGTLDPKEIICFVIDEAHRARKNYAYTNVVKFVERFNTSFRVLALTATPAADIEGVQEVVDNLSISHIEIRTEESNDIVKYMKRKEQVKINVGSNIEMENVIELLGTAIEPILKQANEANIYEVTDPSRINAFQVMMKSQAIIQNPTLNEGIKWKYYFILQVIGYVGQMLRRLKIYGVRSFYSYYQNKCNEFRAKHDIGKSTNKLAASFFFHPALRQIKDICDKLMENAEYVSHPKLEYLITELQDFFAEKKSSRVIVFTELRESALEIVKAIDNALGDSCKSHIFIGQARGKEKFDEADYKIKNAKKGRGKKRREERLESEQEMLEQKERQKKEDAEKRAVSRTGTSEEAQLQGMNQKTQKELIKKFKKGEFQVLVATSIGEEGLDIGEVDLIICYDTTSSPIKNIQRMGRTGRKNDGKVILLFASNEESKFNQAMEDYSLVQKRISHNELNFHKSDRIIPSRIVPDCEKRLIEIPEGNLIIARGEDEDEVIKHATQAMLGKTSKGKKTKQTKSKSKEPPAPAIKKKFFMPDHVETGFVNSSTLVRKVGENSSRVDQSLDSNGDDNGDDDLSITKNRRCSNKSANTTANSSNILGNLFSNGSPSSKIPTPRKFLRSDIEVSQKNSSKSASTTVIDTSRSGLTDTSVIIDLEGDDDEGVDSDIQEVEEPKVVDILGSSPIKPLQHTLKAEMKFSEAFEDNEEDECNATADAVSRRIPKLCSTNVRRVLLGTQGQERAESHSKITDMIPDSDEEFENDDDSRLLNETLKDIQNRPKFDISEPPLDESLSPIKPLSKRLLDFDAFGDSDNELEVDNCPLKEAEKVMEKQFDEDPSFILTGEQETQPPKKRKVVESSKPNTKKKMKSPEPPKVDIANLLKETKIKKSLGVRRLKTDTSKLRPSQIIDLDQETQHLKKREFPDKIYMSQRDCVASNEFGSTDGFMNEEERRVFFAEVFYTNEISLHIDPSVSVKRIVNGQIGHSSRAKRFISFSSLCAPRCNKRLGRLAVEYEEKAQQIKQPLQVKVEDFSQVFKIKQELDEGEVDEFSGAPLLSDDDYAFKNL
jgi:ATP-dependent DNA helicase MPH1